MQITAIIERENWHPLYPDLGPNHWFARVAAEGYAEAMRQADNEMIGLVLLLEQNMTRVPYTHDDFPKSITSLALIIQSKILGYRYPTLENSQDAPPRYIWELGSQITVHLKLLKNDRFELVFATGQYCEFEKFLDEYCEGVPIVVKFEQEVRRILGLNFEDRPPVITFDMRQMDHYQKAGVVIYECSSGKSTYKRVDMMHTDNPGLGATNRTYRFEGAEGAEQIRALMTSLVGL